MDKKKTLIKDSLFDDPSSRTRDKYKLWEKNAILALKKTDVKLLEATLFKRSKKKSGYWKQKTYKLYQNKLVAYDEKDGQQKVTAFMIIDNVRLEKIRLEEKEKEVKFGFRFTHNQKFCELYTRTKEIMHQWYDQLRQFCILTTFTHDYSAIKILGKGNFARVYYARSKQTGKEFAVKAFEKEKFQSIEVDRPALIKEISILRKLNHPHVIKMYEVYENESYVFLVKELLKGGELFHKLKGHGSYTEQYAGNIMKNLLSALQYIQHKQILHRDLKPENLILRSKTDDCDLCIADFGLADYYDPKGDYMFKRCGTPGYVAPEVLADKIYDHKVDSFSAGVVMYILLSGSSPFKGKSYDEIVLKNYNCTIDFKYKEIHKKLTPEAFDLMRKLLKKEPKERLSAEEALQHPWFATLSENSKQQETEDNKSKNYQMEDYHGNDKYKRNQNGDQEALLTKTPLMGKEFNTPKDYQSPDTWKRSHQQQNSNKFSNQPQQESDPNLFQVGTPSEGYNKPHQQTPNSIKSQEGKRNSDNLNQQKIAKVVKDSKSVNELDDNLDDSDIEDTPVDENMKQLQQYDFSAKLRMGQRSSYSTYSSPIQDSDIINSMDGKQIQDQIDQNNQSQNKSQNNNNTNKVKNTLKNLEKN